MCFGCNLWALFQELPLPPHIEGLFWCYCLLRVRVLWRSKTDLKIRNQRLKKSSRTKIHSPRWPETSFFDWVINVTGEQFSGDQFGEFDLIRENPDYGGCLVASCLLSSRVAGLVYTYTKISCGFLNLFAGTIFLIKLTRYNKSVVKPLLSSQSVGRRTNKMAALVICLELCFNFIPQVTAIILSKVCRSTSFASVFGNLTRSSLPFTK
ncbi:hypothetical protein DdX_19374 [Ditylenchus destructor]|uniref:Uncharacterized protein n=1 Tax=Ditylenchus destructor TaxID=166010 RepID=A0AAD4MKJ9_9BILA|nr:hypothetical protein DdX_19374 [Ditylenchus destructor]